MTPKSLPMWMAVRHRFERQEMDGATLRARLLALVIELAATLRTLDQVARGLTPQLGFAAGARWTKTLRLPEPSARDDDLRTAAYRVMDPRRPPTRPPHRPLGPGRGPGRRRRHRGADLLRPQP
ncbi:hypothetical protein [Streptomyces sp. NPDC050264]|uniref:DinB/UmuC family translesion DNA polymerase n=1 Tax=Streptomyces sp. NPDC050264 TaxID=3155038 RepID=UPI003440BAEF